MKKFLIGFGGLLILLGAGGIINHVSMAFKAVEEEREMYGGSVQFMLLQLIGSLGPYLTCLVGGGLIIALAAFIMEYQKRSELTSELIKALSTQRQAPIEETRSNNKQIKPQLNEEINEAVEYEPYTQQENGEERLYWNG
ncbi:MULTISPECIES: hypothetical protein [Bacillaceae]|uniref:hypothetical protein n=1 Tax=Bacillaceae TaxID=186817 RepID=UPI000BFBFA93|nr:MULTISPECIES: hypothetical protein [Bacillaceae]PGT82469.1 hypothetical protein COD11_14940 [Bacillus sp. AFS040349]UGB31284.1 hypothetical protein LPC09_01755 [Metabacillus sp. B2-18]